MAEKYQIDGYRGTGYLIDSEGRFTGEVSPMWDSENKNKAIDNFVKAFDIDLSKSYAYGDTNGDLSMLSRVGNPVAINPAKELLLNIKHSPELSQKATIIIERKDLIYKLSPSVEIIDENSLLI
jgi:phosphoserine phosphatase